MTSTVLVTGALGAVGRYVLPALVGRGHRVRAFDLPSPAARAAARDLGHQVEVVWGDVRRGSDVAAAMAGVDVVLHLAFVIPPRSETDPALAHSVNVTGTRTLVETAARLPQPPRFVLTSSYHVHPYQPQRRGLLTAESPTAASDHYAAHKIEAERLVRESGLRWSVLRLTSVLLDRGPDPDNLAMMVSIPLDTRVEFVDPRDLAVALSHAAERPEVDGRTLLVGGGPACRTTYRRLYACTFDALGLAPLPESAFARATPFIGDWVDSREAERLLTYQRHGLDEWVQARRVTGLRRAATRLASPAIRAWMLHAATRSARSLERRRVTASRGT
jgi:nucleoside-diphosphate-sugar epimerase